MIGEWRTATDAMAKAGVLIDCARLPPRPAAHRTGCVTANTLLIDCRPPISEAAFGGYTLIECGGPG